MHLQYNSSLALRKAMAEFSQNKPNFPKLRDQFKEEQKAAHKRVTEQTRKENQSAAHLKLDHPETV